MNTIAICYVALITFISGILITNYSRIEQFIESIYIQINAYSVVHMATQVFVGAVYLYLPVVLYQLVKAKMDYSLNGHKSVMKMKRTLAYLICIILINK